MEVDSIPQPAPESAAQIESADLVVGVLADLGQEWPHESVRWARVPCPGPRES